MGIIIIGILFFIFGFVTWLNATLIPYLKIACELQHEWQGYLVTFAFYIAYFVMALPSSWVLRKTGYKNGMMLGLLVMAVGALLFIPAAMTRTYGLFLLGLFIMGTGLSVLQTASNPYVIELGPAESAAQRVSIMGICNKVAGAISPLILGSIMLKDIDLLEAKLQTMDAIQKAAELNILASKSIVPYVVIMVSLVVLALFVRFSPLPQIEDPEEEEGSLQHSGKSSIFSFPHLWIGIVTLFLYVGVEVIAIDTIIGYAQSMKMDHGYRPDIPDLRYDRHDCRLHHRNHRHSEIHQSGKSPCLLCCPRSYPRNLYRHVAGRDLHLVPDAVKSGKLTHVARHLPACHLRVGTSHEDRIGPAYHGYRRRSLTSNVIRFANRFYGTPRSLLDDVALLPIHFVLCGSRTPGWNQTPL